MLRILSTVSDTRTKSSQAVEITQTLQIQSETRHSTLFFCCCCFFPSSCVTFGLPRRERKKNHIPGENPVYISHLMSCKCYINIFHQVEFKNYHSHKCTYTHKHIYCMYSTCRLLVESHNNSRPTPTCSGFHFTLGIHVDQQQRNKQTKQIRFLPHWHIFRQAGHKSGSTISDLFCLTKRRKKRKQNPNGLMIY